MSNLDRIFDDIGDLTMSVGDTATTELIGGKVQLSDMEGGQLGLNEQTMTWAIRIFLVIGVIILLMRCFNSGGNGAGASKENGNGGGGFGLPSFGLANLGMSLKCNGSAPETPEEEAE